MLEDTTKWVIHVPELLYDTVLFTAESKADEKTKFQEEKTNENCELNNDMKEYIDVWERTGDVNVARQKGSE